MFGQPLLLDPVRYRAWIAPEHLGHLLACHDLVLLLCLACRSPGALDQCRELWLRQNHHGSDWSCLLTHVDLCTARERRQWFAHAAALPVSHSISAHPASVRSVDPHSTKPSPQSCERYQRMPIGPLRPSSVAKRRQNPVTSSASSQRDHAAQPTSMALLSSRCRFPGVRAISNPPAVHSSPAAWSRRSALLHWLLPPTPVNSEPL